MHLVTRFLADRRGATAVEYSLMAAGISLAIVIAVNGLGARLGPKFSAISSSLK